MTLERVGRIRTVRALRAAVATGLALSALSGCGGKSGVHTQTPTSGPPSSASASPTPSTSSTEKPSTSATSGIPTPSVTAPAQSAVDAYIAFYNESGGADRDPAQADILALDRYLTGKARTLFDSNYASMKKSGLAYRGTAPDPRVKVQQVFSATSVFLTSCPLESKTDPYIEYTVSTGKPIATRPKRNPPPPYLLILPMVKVGDRWKLSDVLPSTGKTCTG